MAEKNYTIPDNPEYDPNIRELQDSDPASASGIFNPLLQKIISNIHFLKLRQDKKADIGTDGKIPLAQLPVDSELSETSQNPVQNKVVQAALKVLNDTITTINSTLSGKAASNHSHNAATTSAAGFMSATDKSKLDGIAAKATANAASTTTPKALGTAVAGSEAGFARGDHVHPKPSLADLGAAAANHSHTGYAAASHNHSAGNITSGILAIGQGGTGNASGYVQAGQNQYTPIGDKATAEGISTTASGNYSHAEGYYSTASGNYSHAECQNTTASSDCSHSEGYSTTASGSRSHAEGSATTASGSTSHAEGQNATASGNYSHAEGYHAKASNIASHAGGKFNKAMTDGGATNNKTGDVLVIGNGTSASALSNAFRVTYAGQVYGLAQFQTSGADYAEYFEWLDANPDNEDRVGFFVTMEGEKIRKANAGDYILGIVSGNPCIIGNADEDWLGRWEHDEFGRFKTIEVETPVTELQTKEVPVLDDNGEPTGEVQFETEEVATGEVIKGWDYKANPDYDPTQQYIERKDRQEWSAVGMLGVLSVRDDGSCQVNGFCQCADGGIATAANKYIPGQTYRVIARVTESIVKVVFR